MEYIDVATAMRRSGKSDKTIRNWIKSHEHIEGAVKRDSGLVMVLARLLEQDYSFQSDTGHMPESFDEQKQAVQLSITANTLEMHQKELQARNEEIKLLLSRRSWIPFWMAVAFIGILIGLGWAFDGYRNELRQKHENNLLGLKAQSEAKEEALAYLIEAGQEKEQKMESRINELEKNALIMVDQQKQISGLQATVNEQARKIDELKRLDSAHLSESSVPHD